MAAIGHMATSQNGGGGGLLQRRRMHIAQAVQRLVALLL